VILAPVMGFCWSGAGAERLVIAAAPLQSRLVEDRSERGPLPLSPPPYEREERAAADPDGFGGQMSSSRPIARPVAVARSSRSASSQSTRAEPSAPSRCS
jgi:hypothetical protein